MDALQTLFGITGWQSLLFLALSVVIGGVYIRRTSKANAEEIAKKASHEAIEALQTQVNVLQDRIKYLERALMEVGIHVSIDGKIEHIHRDREQ